MKKTKLDRVECVSDQIGQFYVGKLPTNEYVLVFGSVYENEGTVLPNRFSSKEDAVRHAEESNKKGTKFAIIATIVILASMALGLTYCVSVIKNHEPDRRCDALALVDSGLYKECMRNKR